MSIKVAIGTHVSRPIRNKWDRFRLKNENFTILSNNCMAGKIYHDLGLKFLTPTINIYIKPDQFVLFLSKLDYFLNLPVQPVVGEYKYPVGKIGDVYLYFKHYSSFDEAVAKWNERKKRINKDNLYVMMTDRYLDLEQHDYEPRSCSSDVFSSFDSLPFKHKICLTAEKREEKSCYQLKEFENEKCVGVITDIVDLLGKRMYQLSKFDYVSWLNHE